MSKEYKNYAVPLEAVEILFLPALRRLSRAVPRTRGGYIAVPL